MVESHIKTRVADPHAKETISSARQDPSRPAARDDGPLTNRRVAAPVQSPTSPSTQPPESQSPTQNGGLEARSPSKEAPMDPLSHHILKRTNTASSAAQKYRVQAAEATGQAPLSPNDGHADSKNMVTSVREAGGAKADKRKGVSFLSRFIGTKKKGLLDDDLDDHGSELGDQRPEGMDAQLFSHTAENLGYQPKRPQRPAYIKVRSRFIKEKEFNRVFLAQELRSRADRKKSTASETSGAKVPSGAAASHNPIWAVEFSKDGRYLAAGGQDRVVRVWAVLSTPQERRAHEENEDESKATRLSAPVFQQRPYREYLGHQATVLDLSWSKNNFLLSSSMDKTVRLWHLTRSENLCVFKHSDFVPSIRFHPRDDRFFLAGSLDQKLRLWSIPDKSVAFQAKVPDMITAVALTPDGKTCIAGTLGGLCLFYDVDGLKLQSQIHVKSTRGQNAKGSKITGIQAVYWPPGSKSGEVKLLITSNDSRVRVYNLKDKTLEMKFRAHENNCSQIKASFADDSGHVICGSEDRKAYIWSTGVAEGEKRNQRPVEIFEAHSSITTCAIFAPQATRRLLSASEDPIFDLCNPPPITLMSRAESMNGSKPPTEAGSALPTPAESTFTKATETPAYIARSAHTDGNIIVTADYTGSIKVFRQDCAFSKRNRLTDNLDGVSVFSKRTNSKLGRSTSIVSLARSRRDSITTQPPNERIMSWRQGLAQSSFDSVNGPAPRRSMARSTSPRRSKRSSMGSVRPLDSPALVPLTNTSTPSSGPRTHLKSQISTEHLSAHPGNAPSESSTPSRSHSRTLSPISSFDPVRQANPANPLSIWNGQSWAFWTTNSQRVRTAAPKEGDERGLRPELRGRESVVSEVSALSLEYASAEEGEGRGEREDRCSRCGRTEGRVHWRGLGGKEVRVWVCGGCGGLMEMTE